ncbi:MAG: hypothetical protein IKL96_07065 [Kiritimatiellae bacterium]|nr:hypothetical protein [Kiritimatiellia bacterium]
MTDLKRYFSRTNSPAQRLSATKPLWRYFQDVIAWTKRLFPTYRKGMEKVEWGILYNQYHEKEFEDTR